MQDHTFDELREALGAQQGEGFEEKLKNLLNQKSDDPDWADEMKMREEYRQKLEPKYVIVKHRGSYCFRADYTDYHRSLLDKDEIYNHLCDGGGFWGVDGENHRVTLYDSSSDFGRPKHIEEAIRNDGERLLKLLGEIGDKEGNKYDLTGYDVTYMDAIGHRHVVKPWTAEEREEIRKRNEEMEREEIAKQTTVWASGHNPHKHIGGRQEPKDYRKKKKAKRRQQKQARRRK
jgi:hypothetical protein